MLPLEPKKNIYYTNRQNRAVPARISVQVSLVAKERMPQYKGVRGRGVAEDCVREVSRNGPNMERGQFSGGFRSVLL